MPNFLEKNVLLRERFCAEFLADLPGRIAELRRAVASEADAAALFRGFHSIKGSAATFGLHFLATIGHQCEDLILQRQDDRLTGAELRALLEKYLELMLTSGQALVRDGQPTQEMETCLADLRRTAFHNEFSVLVAVHSRVLREMCAQVLAPLQAHFVVAADSHASLARLLGEPFQLFIASSELAPLRGEALIAALKLSGVHARNLTAVLVSADSAKAKRVQRDTDPDHVILRDGTFLANLETVCGQAHERYQRTR